MNSFIAFSALVSVALGAPSSLLVKPYITSGSPAGPLTAAFGDLASTSRGLRPVSLEGFSEDVNEDGFVDPLAQAVAPVVVPAVHIAPAAVHIAPAAAKVEVKAVEPVEVKVDEVKASLPVVSYSAALPAVHHAVSPVIGHRIKAIQTVHAVPTTRLVQSVHHTVHHVPKVTVQKHVTTHTTQHVINHAPVIGSSILGVVPAVASAVEVKAEEPAAVEAA